MDTLLLVLVVIGTALIFVSGIWLLVIAYGRGCLWFLACFFIPGASLVLAILHAREDNRPLILMVVGIFLLFGGALALDPESFSDDLPEEAAAGAGAPAEDWESENPEPETPYENTDSYGEEDEGQFEAFDDFQRYEGDEPYGDDEGYEDGTYADEPSEEDWDARGRRAQEGIREFNRRRNR